MTTKSIFLAVAISISTVLVKQHFIADVPAGMALAWLAWWLAGKWTPRPAALR